MNLFDTNRQNKIICVGRNYVAHAKELNNPIPSEPLLFMKPWTSIVPLEGDIEIPSHLGEVHHELEIAFVIGERLCQASEQQAKNAISGIGLALDLTLRDIQTQLKAQKQPWEKAKGFDGACPIECIDINIQDIDLDKLSLSFMVNRQIQQQGSSAEMIFKPLTLISYISQWFTLMPGDVVLTGTPAGVDVLQDGDTLESVLAMHDNTLLKINSRVIT